MAQTVLRLPEVKARTGLSRSTIYLKRLRKVIVNYGNFNMWRAV
jgi:hypothetical protein